MKQCVQTAAECWHVQQAVDKLTPFTKTRTTDGVTFNAEFTRRPR